MKFSRKRAVATSTIIYITLGILVLVLAGYFISTRMGGLVGFTRDCENKKGDTKIQSEESCIRLGGKINFTRKVDGVDMICCVISPSAPADMKKK